MNYVSHREQIVEFEVEAELSQFVTNRTQPPHLARLGPHFHLIETILPLYHFSWNCALHRPESQHWEEISWFKDSGEPRAGDGSLRPRMVISKGIFPRVG